jgi:thioredoxin reductase
MTETPARIAAILGAGPTGLEAALTAAQKGFSFTLYEAAPTVASYLRIWGHVRLFSPWKMDVSPRVRKALKQAGREVPAGLNCPTGAELADRVFEPLAKLPILAQGLRLRTQLLAVSREGYLKHEEIGSGRRARRPFRLLLTNSDGQEWTETADVVMDCTGTYAHPNPMGDGGIPAPGEVDLEGKIVRWIPNLAVQTQSWADKTILLVGAGHSAQTAIVDLAELAQVHSSTRIFWPIRRSRPEWNVLPDDPLPARAALIRRAQELAKGASPAVTTLCGVAIDALSQDNGKLVVTLRQADGDTTTIAVDRILSLTGFAGDHQLYRQLQVHECWATSGPMKLAASLLASHSDDCLDQTTHGAETLRNPEPNFYILGSKSYGRNSSFLMQVGWQQVEEVFSLLEPLPDR